MIDSNNNIKFLDCTLRDGSYANNFAFTSKDTSMIVSGLDKLDFNYIEVGHGIGLGASLNTGFKAAESDLNYMIAAASAINKSKWGMFCIPGVASLDDVRLAADNNIDFLRIGTDIENVSSAIEFIELSKNLGIEVFVNFMKSYVVSPDTFSKVCSIVIDCGIETIYLVDSSGSMLPDEIRKYINVFYENHPTVVLGFHGHDNLGLSTYNSLVCVQEGVKLIDTTIQGFGRGAGNTPIEEFLSVLGRYGIETNINYIDLLNFSEKISDKVAREVAWSTLDVVSGFAGFHSSYMPKILEISRSYNIDPKSIIIELCKVNQTDAPKDLLNSIARELVKKGRFMNEIPANNKYFGQEQG